MPKIKSLKGKDGGLKAGATFVVRDNKKCVYQYSNSKRRAKENIHPLLDVVRNFTTEGKVAQGSGG